MKLKPQVRFLQAAPDDINVAERTVQLSFSSESPVERYFGTEVLDHGANSADLSRFNNGANVLVNHNPDDYVGVIENASIGADRRGRATVRFGKSERAQQIFQDVQDKVLRNVSFMYQINSVREDAKKNEFRVMSWMPMELSIVTIPADPSVGIGRAHEAGETEVQICEPVIEPDAAVAAVAVRDVTNTPANPATTPKGIAMSDATTAAAGAHAETQVNNDGTQIERLRIRTIHDLCRQHKIDDKTRDEWIDKGMTVDVAASKTLDMLAERNRSAGTPAAVVGMSNKDVRNYSLHRAVQSILGHGNWEKAGLEFEAHKTIRDRLNRDCGKNSFFVPVEIQERAVGTHEKRDLTVATSSAGGYLVETSNQGFIDILRNRSVVMAMGARRLTGLVGNLTIPKQTGAATAYWLNTESTSITEGAITLGQLALSPKNVGAYVEISRQLLLQSSPSAEQITMTDLAAQLGLAVDTASISGSGASGQPTGIFTTSGIGTSPSGTSLDYANVIKFQTDVAGANALTSSCGYVTTPTVAGLLMARQRFSNTDTPLWNGSILNATMAGFNAMSSNQMPTAKMLFGDWQQLVIAEWGVLEVEVNPVANFQAGIVGVRAIYSVDVGLRYAGAFSSVASIT